MPVTYTNRKGRTYILYQGQTKSGKPRYFFGYPDQHPGQAVEQLPPGFTISESINGVVSLVKVRPPLIRPEEGALVEAVLKQHPQAHLYRSVVKHNMIEMYERPDVGLDLFPAELQPLLQFIPNRAAKLQAEMEQRAQYTPVLRFILLDQTQRLFGAQRMCYRSSIDGWLDLHRRDQLADLAHQLIPTLGTDRFFELW